MRTAVETYCGETVREEGGRSNANAHDGMAGVMEQHDDDVKRSADTDTVCAGS